MKEPIVVSGLEVAIKGEVMFSNITEARGFKEEDKKSFGITLKISAADADAVMAAVDALEAKVYDEATSALSTAQKKAVGKAVPKYKFIEDASGEPTGELRIEFKRPERFGSPLVRKLGDTDPVERSYINKGSTVVMRATARHYKMGSTHGTSYTLKDVLIMDEAERGVGGSRASAGALDKLMEAVDINDLPF